MTRHAVTTAWLVLVLATAVSWWLGGGASTASGLSTRLATGGLLLVAFVKVRLIVRYFMEVRQAPFALRAGFDAWIGVVFLAVLILYLRAPG